MNEQERREIQKVFWEEIVATVRVIIFVASIVFLVAYFASKALSATPDDDAAAALALAQAQAQVKPLPKADAYPHYTYAAAKAQSLPVVVFVGKTPAYREWQGLSVFQAETLEGCSSSCVVVGKNGEWLATLPCGCDEAAIRAALVPKAVSQSADPFDKSNSRSDANLRQAPVDGKRVAAGPQFHSGHRCPQCGTTVTVISGRGPSPGTHLHVCPRDNTTWFH